MTNIYLLHINELLLLTLFYTFVVLSYYNESKVYFNFPMLSDFFFLLDIVINVFKKTRVQIL